MVRKSGIQVVCPLEPQHSPFHTVPCAGFGSLLGKGLLYTSSRFCLCPWGPDAHLSIQEAVRGLRTPPKLPTVEDLFVS